MAAGRPLKFATPEELEEQAEAYFSETPIEKWTITGLALALDTTRDVLCDYQLKDEFSNTIKRMKLKVEHAYELRGMEKGTSFDIFRLKNMGWKDKIETDNTTRHQIDRIDLMLISADGKPQG
jgi:hypothetical protein